MKLRIKNFRSLKDTGDVEIKPITILIGRNSSGKSSFLRTFPMLKQSVEEKTKTPILFYGNYVDFGSINDIKPHFNKKSKEKYELSFSFDNDLFEIINRRNYIYNQFKRRLVKNIENINFSLRFEENKKQLIQISEIIFVVNTNHVSITLDHDKKIINELKVNDNVLFTQEDNIRFSDKGEFVVEFFKLRKRGDFFDHERIQDIVLHDTILKVLNKFVHSRTGLEAKFRIIENVNIATDELLLKDLQKITLNKKFQKNIENWDINNPDFIELRNGLFLYEFLAVFLNSINVYLKNTFTNIKYIAPLRATAERYYRIQHLAIDEVDPNGKNLPVFLDSLSDKNMQDFQNWTFDNFNFKTVIFKIEGHYSIRIIHDDNYQINLSDMGFGYSQILPILTQIWYSSLKIDSRSTQPVYSRVVPTTIVIEQPELHLHPEFQAKFADAISKVITYTKDRNVKLNLIIETHSDIIINRLGDNILSKDIKHSDINIVVFNKLSDTSPTEITTAKYDKVGNLVNWPLGFFLPTSHI